MSTRRAALRGLVLGSIVLVVLGIVWGGGTQTSVRESSGVATPVSSVPSWLAGTRAVARRVWLVATGGLGDAGGHRLRIKCQGNGSPTVILDAGLAQTMYTWGTVPTAVAQFTRVCAYDRAGLGDSDKGPVPRTSQTIVDELHAALADVYVEAPLVLVGHSFGGINVRLYASQHPEQVVGLVLVDASHEDQLAEFLPFMSSEEQAAKLREEAGENYESIDLRASNEQVRTATLPDLPLVVVTAGCLESGCADGREVTGYAAVHRRLQLDLLDLAPGARQVVARKSGHFVQLDEPDVVVEAIRLVTEAARS